MLAFLLRAFYCTYTPFLSTGSLPVSRYSANSYEQPFPLSNVWYCLLNSVRVACQGASTTCLRLRAGMTSSKDDIFSMEASNLAFALVKRSFCIVSSIAGIVVPASAQGTFRASEVSLRTTRVWRFSTSRGPISSLRGTPFSSQSLNFQPGV